MIRLPSAPHGATPAPRLTRAAVIVVASTALTTTTLGLAAPAGAASDPGPVANPGYTTSTIPVEPGPTVGVAVDESTNTAYVTNPKSAPQGAVPPNGTVSVINLTTKLVTHRIEVGTYPMSIAVDPSNHRVYIANAGTSNAIGTPIGNTVSVIDATTNAVTGSVAVPGLPQAVAVDPDTHLAYVVHHGDGLTTFHGVSALDPNSLTFGENIPVGLVPQGIAIAAGRAYVPVRFYGTASSVGALAAINLTNKNVTYTQVGSDPSGVAVDPTTDRAYVTQGARSASGIDVDFGVAVVNTTANTSLGTIRTGDSFPILAAVDSGTHTAYVTNADGTVAIIDTTTSQLAGTVTVGGPPGVSRSTERLKRRTWLTAQAW